MSVGFPSGYSFHYLLPNATAEWTVYGFALRFAECGVVSPRRMVITAH